jgi:hypothetical protein
MGVQSQSFTLFDLQTSKPSNLLTFKPLNLQLICHERQQRGIPGALDGRCQHSLMRGART